MRTALLGISLVMVFFAGGAAQQTEVLQEPVTFVPLHIYLDSGDQPLSVYQFELKITRGDVRIVGVEGGEHPAFQNAPYYDPKALSEDRIIIAAYSTDSSLPTGRTRIATLHLQVRGQTPPEYKLALTVSADAQGKPIPATITFKQGETQ